MIRLKRLSDSFGYLVAKVGQDTFDTFAEKLAPHGLRPRHCGALAALAGLGAPSQQELGKALGVVPSAIVGLIDDLERLGAISRVADPHDRRRFRLETTAHGHKLLREAIALSAQVDATVLASLSAAERRSLRELLARVAQARCECGG